MDPRKRVHVAGDPGVGGLPVLLPDEGDRNGGDGNLRFIDRVANGTVSVDPGTRRKLLLERIVILETLWDLSANLKARRLKRMFTAAWPKLFDQETHDEFGVAEE